MRVMQLGSAAGRQKLSLEVSSRLGVSINRRTATQRISYTSLSDSYPASDKSSSIGKHWRVITSSPLN